MVKCYLTGVELEIEEAYLIDLGPAYRLLQQLRHQTSAVERLIAQLGPRDEVAGYDPVKKKNVVYVRRRLVSPTVSNALGQIYPEKSLFIKWTQWKARAAAISRKSAGKDRSGKPADGRDNGDDSGPDQPQQETGNGAGT
jgi:hypothetical protein